MCTITIAHQVPAPSSAPSIVPAPRPEPADIGVTRHGSHALVVVCGELDAASAPRLPAVLRDRADRGEHRTMDLGCVRRSDGAGLRPLAEADACARREGRRFTTVSAVRPVRRTMGLTDLGHLVESAVST
ncbi:STAS domain-containing protein [Streptomyces sp. NPDC050743]|uniref:STAS domain-containing protein n=1 Tax=Streptomyces sp. NPDC050743 TaxID=3365634 RepID=UPI00379ABF33